MFIFIDAVRNVERPSSEEKQTVAHLDLVMWDGKTEEIRINERAIWDVRVGG